MSAQVVERLFEGIDEAGGDAVNLASRIESAASAGEVLVSRTVPDLTFGSELGYRSRGEHELKR